MPWYTAGGVSSGGMSSYTTEGVCSGGISAYTAEGVAEQLTAPVAGAESPPAALDSEPRKVPPPGAPSAQFPRGAGRPLRLVDGAS
eukprot:7910265-Pyramimonas_sp.AAC.1